VKVGLQFPEKLRK